ncbi:MAG: ferritin family protein [Desulfobacterales bacterium]|nr:MAG: ferritin family protein [Desulfobacterales bacterium]
MRAWQGLSAAGPAEMGLVLLRGDEHPAEIIILAYGLEQGLGEFYTAMKAVAENSATAAIFDLLAGIEAQHKEKLYQLYLALNPAPLDRPAFAAKVTSQYMEGGFTTEEFVAQNRPALQTDRQVLDMAMMLEAQALDLYTRYAAKSAHEETKTLLLDIANEEKAHLKRLGALLEDELKK